jgi:hypothetical protein
VTELRTIDQNKKLWAMLSDVASQIPWPVNGSMVLMASEDWKDVFTASLRKHNRVAMGIDGGFVILGMRTSKMKKQQFADLIEIIYAFGAERGVVWSEPCAQ